ncbi:unnamed protein product, partial [Staurois parvus]
ARVRETRYSECRVRGDPDIVHAGSGESRYSECRGSERPDIVNAGSEKTRYSEWHWVRGDRIYSECRVRGD